MLEGFEPVYLGFSGPSASITKNGITFSKQTSEAFGKAKIEFATLQLNREEKKFAILQASKNDLGAMPFTSANAKTPSVRWNNKDLLRLFSSLMGWDLKACSGYRIPGVFSKEARAVIFDLNTAIPLKN